MRKQKIFWIIVIFLMPVLACGIFGGAEGGEAGLETDLGAPTAAASESPAAETVVEEVDTVKEEEPTKSDAISKSVKFTGVTNLDALSSYRVNFIMDFDGQSGGQPAKGHIEMTLEVTKDPPARHMTMSMEGTTVEEVGGTNAIEFYNFGDTVYMKNAVMGDQWISFSGGEAEAFQQGFFAPDEQLEVPDTANCAGQPETVNGVSAIHCSFTEKDIVSDEVAYEGLQGDVWVATEGNHIVKFILEAKNYRSLQQGEGLFDFGSASFEYNLLDMNGDFTITLPEAAKNAGGVPDVSGGDTGGADTGDIPVLDNAEETMSMSGFISYYTASDIATVVEFYRQELPALGWQEDANQGYADDSSALLSFSKEGKMLMVTITIEDDRTSVIVATVDQ
ncbi:MAG: hypothetical protein JW953_20335 [Anaerolineae bacterium]|nr:hypothetical protein [Anaerolineae bacterium]